MPKKKRSGDDDSSAEEGEISEESDYEAEARPKKAKKAEKKEPARSDKGRKSKSKGKSSASESGSDSDHSEFQFEYDDEGYRDDDDRNKLWDLPEIERERILAERLEKRDVAKDRWELKQKLKKAKRGRVQASASEDRGKRRTEAKKADKRTAALDDIRKRKDSRKERPRGEEEEEEGEAQSSPERSPARRSPEPRRERERRERERTPPAAKQAQQELFKDDREEASGGEEAEILDLERLRLTRDLLEKWIYEPWFDEVVVGLYVRFGMGIRDGKATYRIMEIEGVRDYRKVYTLGKSPTQKGLLLKGFSSNRVSPMEYVSNKPFTADEFLRFQKLVRAIDARVISKEEVKERRKKIERALNHVHTPQEVEAMLRAKQAVGAKPRNLAAERAALLILLEEAKGDPDRLLEITEELDKLDGEIAVRAQAGGAAGRGGGADAGGAAGAAGAGGGGGGSSLVGTASINKRAQEENFKRQLEIDKRKAEEAERKKAMGAASKLDPFSRRPCAPTATIFAKAKREKEERERQEREAAEAAAKDAASSQPDEPAAAASEARSGTSPAPPSVSPLPREAGKSPSPMPAAGEGKTESPAARPAAAGSKAAGAGSALLSAHASIDIDIKIDPPGPSSGTTFRPLVARQSPLPAGPAAPAEPAAPVKKLSIQDYRRRAGV
eukprot:tig00001278_g7983.t1